MTNEEAIQAIKCNWPDSRYTILREALDMAISALRQQETVASGEIALNAKTMTLDDAIAHLDDTLSDTGRKWSCESCRMEHVQLRAWLAELRYIKRKRNAPLTLAELRKMDGEPVYSVEITGREEWLFRRDGGFADMYGEFTSDDFMSWDNYGKLWWCYRRKPEEGTV